MWQELPDPPLDPAFTQAVGGNPLVARLLVQRGYDTPDQARAFLSPDCYTPAPADDLPDLVAASDRLDRALRQGERILVWGDFDVDGQTATALLLDALRSLGGDVVTHIPHRLRDGHGLHLDRLRALLHEHAPALLLTCDTGLSDAEAVDYAKARGLPVIITDHHALPSALPAADAILNPRRLPPDHPLAALPGVGVVYKLIEHLYTQRSRAAELPAFLDLVALGIVADVAAQTGDTRYLLQRGLAGLQVTERVGLRALVEVAGLPADRLNADDIAFQLAPRLNAAGRLDDAALVVDLLTTADPMRAHPLALQLEGLNNRRRLLTRQVEASARAQVAADPALLDDAALVLYDPAWHAGIIGLVAGRLAERYQRPLILLTAGADPDTARGSARGAPGCDLEAALATQSDLLLRHGGHAGAAGLTLPLTHLDDFRRRLDATLRAACDLDAPRELAIDAVLGSLGEITPELVSELHRLAPFGEGNPAPTLAVHDLTLHSAAFVGRGRAHRRLTVQDSFGHRQAVLWWNSADLPLPRGPFDLAFTLDFNRYQGGAELQVTLADFRRAASLPPEVALPPRAILDYRAGASDETLRALLAEYPDAAVWAEGYRRADSPGLALDELPAAETLIILTAPPDPAALRAALARVQPRRVALLGIDPPLPPGDALRRLLELLKFVVNRQRGATTRRALAAALGQSPAAVSAALDTLAAHGAITVYHGREDRLTVALGDGVATGDADAPRARFEALLAETAAYRAFFRRARPEQLLGDEDDA